MSSEEAKKFREAQRRSARKAVQGRSQSELRQPRARQETSIQTSRKKPNVQLVNPRKSQQGDMLEFPISVYKAPAGTAHKADSKKKRMTPTMLKIASVILAAAIGIGGLNVIGNYSKATNKEDNIQTITQLENQGINVNDIGLNSDTVELLEKYDDYFANFDPNTVTELTDNDVIAIANDIRTLNFNTIKDKVADLTGVSRDDITLRYKYETGDGTYNSSVIINEGEYDEVRYNNINGIIFGIGEQNGIPDEIAKLIIQTREYDDIIEQLKSDKITKRNAIEELRKLYMNISENVATKDFIMNNGEIVITDYSEQIKNQQDREEER